MNKGFWDAHGVEMEACAIFKPFAGSWILPGSHSGISWLSHTSFRDAQVVEIGACANFDVFSGSGKLFRPGVNYEGWMLWVVLVQHCCPSALMHPALPGRLMGPAGPRGSRGACGVYTPPQRGGSTPHVHIPHCGIIHYGVPVAVPEFRDVHIGRVPFLSVPVPPLQT